MFHRSGNETDGPAGHYARNAVAESWQSHVSGHCCVDGSSLGALEERLRVNLVLQYPAIEGEGAEHSVQHPSISFVPESNRRDNAITLNP